MLIKSITGAMLAAWFIFSVKSDNQEESADIVNRWEIGTSSGVFRTFSQDEFDQCKKDGIKYIELSSSFFKGKSESEKKSLVLDIKNKTEKAGMEVWSFHLPYAGYDISAISEESRQTTIQSHVALMEILKPLKIKKFVVHPSLDRIEEAERPERIKNSIISLRILTHEIKRFKASLAVEVLPRRCLGNTSEELLYIVNSVNNGLEVCFDSNHLLKEKPEDFVAKVGKLISTVHISDYDGLDEKHWLPGKGIIDWTKVIAELVNAGYRGPFMHEVVPKASDVPQLTTKIIADNWLKLKGDYLNSIQK